jgi:tetraacyldisaccharide 4'-kinase
MSELIISVGNIALGGTGKTPFTLLLAEYYKNRGNTVAILSRGYKGKLGYGTNIISNSKEIYYRPPLAADEPYMFALRGFAVVTGKKRIASYILALKEFNPAPNVFILDDGFQHRKMKRDVDIVLLDYNNPVSTGFVFPFGCLREFPSAIRRCDIVVFTRAANIVTPAKAAKYVDGKPIFFTNIHYGNFIASGKALPFEDMKGVKTWLLSGIAHPQQFQKRLEAYGLDVIGHSKFADHHTFTKYEIDRVVDSAAKAGVPTIFTTEKDFVRIPAEYRSLFAYPLLEIEFLGSTSEEFFNTISNLSDSRSRRIGDLSS